MDKWQVSWLSFATPSRPIRAVAKRGSKPQQKSVKEGLQLRGQLRIRNTSLTGFPFNSANAETTNPEQT